MAEKKMCGIVGAAGRHLSADHSWLTEARKKLIHRGPDDFGEWWSQDGHVGLAQTRLAVIDLTPGGHQPMSSVDENIHIVFNGEIYNHHDIRTQLANEGVHFRSRSDTEVVVAAYQKWGTECTKVLNGMFAFAIYDRAQNQVFLARDRAGEKPLYFTTADNHLCFASELKALLCAPGVSREIDAKSMDCYLALGFIPGQLCIFEGVRKLPPAHALVFDIGTGRSRTWNYWELPKLDAQGADSEKPEALVQELESLLESAVRRQLVADVPVGILLSGGVDSSLITAMAARSDAQFKTFSVRFPGFGKFDETEHARLIADYFGTEHIELEAEQSSAELMPALARQFDEPMADSSMVPTSMIARLVREHCTVALGGDGGDELFGGYAKYNRYLRMQKQFDVLPLRLRSLLAISAGRVMPVGRRGRNWFQQLGVDLRTELPLAGAHFDQASRDSLLPGVFNNVKRAETVWRERTIPHSDLIQRATRTDFQNYLPEAILTKVDRASMLSSLEVRAPFLDCELVDFAFSKVPSSLKVSDMKRKILLKSLARKVLPSEFDIERKQGFSLPLATWLKKGSWRTLFHDVLTGSECYFDPGAVRKLIAGQDRGHANSERLFSLVLFELWRKEYCL